MSQDPYLYQEIQGSVFKEIYGGNNFINVSPTLYNQQPTLVTGMNFSKFHRTKSYINGEMVDGPYSYGGIKFIREEQIFDCLRYETNLLSKKIRTVEIPDDATVYVSYNDYSASSLYLGEETSFSDLEIWDDEEACKQIVGKSYKMITLVKNLTEDVCWSALKNDPMAIEYINIPTVDMIRYAVTKMPYLARYVKDIPFDICLDIVQGNPYSINNLQIDLDTKLKLIGEIPSLFKDVNQTFELCKMVIDMNPILFRNIKIQTTEICKFAFEKDIQLFQYFKDSMKEFDMCLKAVEFNPQLISYVPKKFCTKELCKMVLEKNPEYIQFISNPDEEFTIMAAKFNSKYIEGIKSEDGFREILEYYSADVVIENNPKAIQFVEQNDNLCLKAVLKDPSCFKLIKVKTEEICYAAIKGDGLLIRYVGNEFSEDMALTAIENNYKSFIYIDGKTHDFIMKAIDVNPRVVEYLQKHKHVDFYNKIAITKDPEAISVIDKKTDELCMMAIERDPKTIRYISNIPDDVAIRAIELDPHVIKLIDRPTISLCFLAILKDYTVFPHIHDKKVMYRDFYVFAVLADPRIMNYVESAYYREKCEKNLEEIKSLINDDIDIIKAKVA